MAVVVKDRYRDMFITDVHSRGGTALPQEAQLQLTS